MLVMAVACGARPGHRAGSVWSGPLTVLAASSLTEPFTTQAAALHADHPELRLAFSFASSSALAAQVEHGSPAGVIATADSTTMQRLVARHLVSPPNVFARNRLEIVVRAGNPRHVKSLGDLGRADLTVVLAAPEVPAGRYARQALDRAGVVVRPRSLELDVKAALAKVSAGEADAAIVYATDVRSGGKAVTGVPIPDEANVNVEYPIAVISSVGGPEGIRARAFVDDVLTGRGHRALRDAGFITGS